MAAENIIGIARRIRHFPFRDWAILVCGCLGLVVLGNAETYQTVTGEWSAPGLGMTLSHEHVLVDFIGAKEVSRERYDAQEAFEVILPYLQRIKSLGCETFVECTPNYIGRDVTLLKRLSEATGLRILTNTGYYGARNNHFLPDHAFAETAEQLAKRWIAEFQGGIEGTEIRPGFIKIGVDGTTLSETHQKLVQAAAITHTSTGLTIASHTGKANLAFEQLNLLKSAGIAPEAFIWVHAQAETDVAQQERAAKEGCWVSLDGYGSQHLERYVNLLKQAKERHWLHRVLLSHDAGWYSPGEPNGGEFRAYTDLQTSLVPALKASGFTQGELDQLLRQNPSRAFRIEKRLLP